MSIGRRLSEKNVQGKWIIRDAEAKLRNLLWSGYLTSLFKIIDAWVFSFQFCGWWMKPII